MTTTLDSIQNAVQTASNTIAQVNDVYVKAKSAAEKIHYYYQIIKDIVGRAEDFLAKLDPYLEPLKPWWIKISNNNDPKRIAIIVGAVVVAYWLIKRAIRPKFSRDYGKYR